MGFGLAFCGTLSPNALRHLISFYNNCSYLVGGHIFSLAETCRHLDFRGAMEISSKLPLLLSLIRVNCLHAKELEHIVRRPRQATSSGVV